MESVEAHWRRELRWMFTISSNPWLASQVPKSKMVLDGVPVSVRWLLGPASEPHSPVFGTAPPRLSVFSFLDNPHRLYPGGPEG